MKRNKYYIFQDSQNPEIRFPVLIKRTSVYGLWWVICAEMAFPTDYENVMVLHNADRSKCREPRGYSFRALPEELTTPSSSDLMAFKLLGQLPAL